MKRLALMGELLQCWQAGRVHLANKQGYVVAQKLVQSMQLLQIIILFQILHR